MTWQVERASHEADVAEAPNILFDLLETRNLIRDTREFFLDMFLNYFINLLILLFTYNQQHLVDVNIVFILH